MDLSDTLLEVRKCSETGEGETLFDISYKTYCLECDVMHLCGYPSMNGGSCSTMWSNNLNSNIEKTNNICEKPFVVGVQDVN